MTPYAAEHRNYVSLTLILVVLCMFSACSPARHATRRAYREAPAEFYQHHSRQLGFQLSGTEDPRLIAEVSSWMGVPYRYGGTNRSGADCSGFVRAVYLNAYGIQLPRATTDQAASLKRTSRRRVQAGDLVFFRINDRKLSHVGLYLGQNKFIHASTSRGVIVNSLNDPYYAKRYKAARKPIR
jgi:murein DD-endopeptidase / murein LD-carboxypeptidase